MENLETYNKLKEVPKQFLKEIQAGRLKGMSDIKPQWRILKLTEVFGACGFGWKIQNLNFTYQVGKENEIVCNCYLEFLYKINDTWSEPIPGIGGSKLTTTEKNGAYVSDEAEKMAYTDAISVATKMIGLASDIYMGYGGKYEQVQSTNNTTASKPTLTPAQFEAMINTINDGNIDAVKQALNKYTVSEQYMTAINLAIKENKK